MLFRSDKLQGSYAIVVSEIQGRKMDTERTANIDRTLVDGDKMIVMRGGKESHRSTIEIDASKDPKWIDVVFVNPQGNKSISKGIYKIDGDMRGRVGQIDTRRCPLFLLSGEYDYSCTPEETMAVANSIPGSHATIMKGLGHFPMS